MHTLKSIMFLHLPVQCDGAEAENGDRAEEFVEELESFAEHQRVKPQAAPRIGSECHIKGDAHQAGTDTRPCQVLDESIGHCFKDVCAAGAPQHSGITCREKERCLKI